MMKTSPTNPNQPDMKLTAESHVMLTGHKVYIQGSHLLHQIFRDLSLRALSLSEGDILNVPSLGDTVNIPSLGDIVNVPYVPPRTRPEHTSDGVCLLVGCLTSQQQASVSQGRIYSDNFTCCHTEIEVADPTFYLTQSQYTDTGPTSPSADPITPGAWQGSHWSANF